MKGSLAKAVDDQTLTVQQARLISMYAEHGNLMRASTSLNVPYSTAKSWIKKPHVKRHIRELRAVFSEAELVTQQFILARMQCIARADVASYFDETNKFVGMNRLSEAQKLAIKSFKTKRDSNGFEEITLTLHDAAQALKLLGNTSGQFVEYKENIDGMTEEELDAELARLEEMR